MNALLAFPLDLPPRGRLEALHGQLRAAILDGRLAGGHSLPSTRALAVSLGVSRNTVVAAYDRLLSEGYVSARHGSGYAVASGLARTQAKVASGIGGDRRLAPHWRHAVMPARTGAPASYRHDLRVGFPDASRFPFDVWRRLSARALRSLSNKVGTYHMPEGRRPLREAIAGHVSFARAVTCGVDDVVVTSGAQQAFDLLARILVTPGRTVVAVEDPGYPPLRAAFEATGASVVPVPVDADGLVVEQIPPAARVIYVTPSHQFPLGMVMSPARRMALLEFARRHGAVVIEDDYDGEFRYGGRPLDALQTLDREGRVFYVGTFSKSLFPALRLGYVVAPPWALAALAQARQVCDWHADVLAQDTLALFIAEGHLARHVRKMRRIYAERREALIHGLVRHAGKLLTLQASDAGLHVAALLPPGLHADELVQRAVAQDMRIEALSGYAIGETAPNGLVFGLGTLPVARMEDATQMLGRLLRESR
ncbi:MAG TPA: PLP-dependent aminotransferase family protein [Dyella sp.]|uniref:MocR-like pyridoxine biosynthesis transcription factor PdxR n=1 Tax=Dyella sp. TaxID=1869338 RepID=UPI002D76D583|nr:PLP-dependent aminotransferase family protein [Dyella sp.]HET6555171.1 PLP-dependent aminotransferase family protein [Dyella sp.]